MDTLLRSGWWCITITSSTRSPYPRTHSIIPRPPKPHSTRLLEAGPRAVRESAEENVLQTFFRERQLNGDFISKASDILWQREVMKFVDADAGTLADSSQQPEQVMANDNDGGFLKLSKTQEWVLGDNSAPVNKKALAKAMQDDSDKRKRLNLLRYEALKRELMFLSIGIGTACSGYCLVALSVQAAISYATGVLFSCLYLQLLYKHVDNLSREVVPQIFMQKKSKKIGVRSEDVKDLLEISIKGSGIALSSPRLVIPAAIYGLWVLSHRYIVSDFLDFQILPAMFGMFVYKAAALFQVYRDNEDLQFVFPENEEGTK
ncbi:uncharacterized protein LOC107409802 isoform X2 [Ziziphus jujuba]|uniref:Uncharacterized protein LOC107409802 isoform X2 n=1 Tax=Ziziphus jujuba TaxID=326968 RepID=A0A6P3ZD04_ZIZJJ|nr:uncharacterized protein LOC107409802 isoform X2 [Ziziphus jujuba]